MILASSILAAAVLSQPQMDAFTFFRERVEPIFLEKRPGHARCFSCHQHRAQFHLQPLPPGRDSWDMEASRRNFATARRLVVPGEPTRSRLLLMALVEDAGGRPFHPGGKFWESRADPDWQTLADWVERLASAAATPPALDFKVFRERVQPIFLAKRDGHARCVSCHQHRAQFHLQPLSPGHTTWTEEEARKNFASARRLVVIGDPLASRLLTMPLAEEAGGSSFHPGGRHWQSTDDPEWRVLAEWVRGTR